MSLYSKKEERKITLLKKKFEKDIILIAKKILFW